MKRKRRSREPYVWRCPGCGAVVAQRHEFCNAGCVLLWDNNPSRVSGWWGRNHLPRRR